nr:ABC transporter E family member 2 [Tanacetum cinerariifolium]
MFFKKCPFDAIEIINLPKDLEKDTTHCHGVNTFKLHRLKVPVYLLCGFEPNAEKPPVSSAEKPCSPLVESTGFDEVEIHAAPGYLIEQFLKDEVNDRTNKPHKRHPIRHKAVDMDSQQGIDGDYREIIFALGVVLAELIASQPSLPCDAKEAIKLNTLISVAIAEQLIKTASKGFGLLSSYNSQNAHLLPSFYGCKMQSKIGVQSIMPHLHFDLDAFQKYYELCVESTGLRYTATLKGIVSDIERNTSDSRKRKVKTCDDYDVFQTYSNMCSQNPKDTEAVNSVFVHTEGFEPNPGKPPVSSAEKPRSPLVESTCEVED